MKPIAGAVVLFLLALTGFSQPTAAPPADAAPAPVPVPSAKDLLRDVVAQLPRDPLLIDGDIVVRKQHGVVARELKFDMTLNWGAEPAMARYRIMDALGKDLEEMTFRRSAGVAPQVSYVIGGNRMADPPSLAANIQSTDITWMDLSLSFLWWGNGTILRSERIRGRTCYVVEVPAPASPPRVDAAAGAYAKVLLWIDADLHMMLQAEGYGRDGKALRTLWIKSLKKIKGRWMIKDLEVQETAAAHRTKMTVRDVRLNGESVGDEPSAPGGEAGEALQMEGGSP